MLILDLEAEVIDYTHGSASGCTTSSKYPASYPKCLAAGKYSVCTAPWLSGTQPAVFSNVGKYSKEEWRTKTTFHTIAWGPDENPY